MAYVHRDPVLYVFVGQTQFCLHANVPLHTSGIIQHHHFLVNKPFKLE